jgi:hypothetical protein
MFQVGQAIEELLDASESGQALVQVTVTLLLLNAPHGMEEETQDLVI